MCKRYLEQAEKIHELFFLLSAGNLDDGMRPLLNRLNRVEGVCTVQSCAGHVRHRYGGSRVENGCFELRLDESATRRFYAAMSDLQDVSGVDEVAISWRPGCQICLVRFRPGLADEIADALVKALTPNESSASAEEQWL